jgi:hypothetical protein
VVEIPVVVKVENHPIYFSHTWYVIPPHQFDIKSRNRVVHSSHFWLIFGFIFGSFSGVWQKNGQNGPKNEVKNEVKNGYCECSEMQTV